MNENKTCILYGMISKETRGYGNNDMIRRVYDANGLAPTLRVVGGVIRK